MASARTVMYYDWSVTSHGLERRVNGGEGRPTEVENTS